MAEQGELHHVGGSLYYMHFHRGNGLASTAEKIARFKQIVVFDLHAIASLGIVGYRGTRIVNKKDIHLPKKFNHKGALNICLRSPED